MALIALQMLTLNLSAEVLDTKVDVSFDVTKKLNRIESIGATCAGVDVNRLVKEWIANKHGAKQSKFSTKNLDKVNDYIVSVILYRLWNDNDAYVKLRAPIADNEYEVASGVLKMLFDEMVYQYFDRVVVQGMTGFPKSKLNTCGENILVITDYVIERIKK